VTIPLRIGLIGDHDPTVVAHQAIPRALALAAAAAGVEVEPTWLPTDAIRGEGLVSGFDGLWCVPATPYRSMEGALAGIGFARENGRPFLGTCGGFQHALVEYARAVLGWADADHAETAAGPAAWTAVGTAAGIAAAAARAAAEAARATPAAYGCAEATEEYHCRYGLNPAFREALLSGPLRVAAVDAAGEVRGVELDGHPFFVATLFQPERAALTGRVPPIVAALVRAATAGRAATRAQG
jgi:CTP synthase (UTP-ammonia lyase)